jgi:hypothetical protein
VRLAAVDERGDDVAADVVLRLVRRVRGDDSTSASVVKT